MTEEMRGEREGEIKEVTGEMVDGKEGSGSEEMSEGRRRPGVRKGREGGMRRGRKSPCVFSSRAGVHSNYIPHFNVLAATSVCLVIFKYHSNKLERKF